MKNRILVIEDDTAISELISMNLTVAGYDTEARFDGNEVEELLKTDWSFWSASKKCWSGPDGRSAGSLWAISRSI